MKQLPLWLLCLLFASQQLFAQTREDYLKWMQQSLPAVPEWNDWQQKTGELPADSLLEFADNSMATANF